MNTIYIRTLKRAEHTVFNVASGQKYYYDVQFNKKIPFSSGQQVKRSLIDSLCEAIDQIPSPTTFLFEVDKQKKLKEGEVYGTCDPTYADQLFGGWMKASKGGGERTLKRRSPLSISAMRALHPLLAGLDSNGGEAGSFDRSERPNNVVIIRDDKGNILSNEEIDVVLKTEGNTDRSLGRKWLNPAERATGLFVFDIAIDLRRLFSVSTNQLEPEMADATIAKLKEDGWIESKNVFGPCLVAPISLREEWIKGLAHAIINWRITSNQSRTFSLMDTLAVSISDNANLIASSIRAKLSEEDSRKADPIIDENLNGVETFISLQAGGFIHTKGEKADALDRAEQALIDKMTAFDYENQIA
ncbi:CRISPR-associated protein Cas7 [Belliella sp. DSM 111904]|uniref:CRISPR-associated protein Cas7 n=1 Tax=Belliella filtrata TaxID=2923435 RepID=A0ABS9UVG9_9BACT|nr:CRISPR-associated protein Cas7 [Belliella filtrata]MCH7408162.1 CRISPR-associated protein Cas7 [Belliella filtrata]